jgi:hypothetical protein
MLHQGGLTGAGMTNDANKLSPLHRERNIVQGLMLKRRPGAVEMGKILDL